MAKEVDGDTKKVLKTQIKEDVGMVKKKPLMKRKKMLSSDGYIPVRSK